VKEDILIEACARGAHEVNRAYCFAIGDTSQVAWESAPEWQRASARNGVRGVLQGNTPKQSHESWLEEKRKTGWKYGPVKDADKSDSSCASDVGTLLLPFGFDDGATFSADRRYRYRLWRSWGSREHRCVFVGVNPSKADETNNDHTITKCIMFAKRWGFGAIDMVNLFAFVSTDVTALLRVDDPVGPDNDAMLEAAFKDAHRIVCCWGKHNARVASLVRARLSSSAWMNTDRPGCEVGTLGWNQDGSPCHPLMLPYARRFEPLAGEGGAS
jgi:hypothetical protein